MKESNEFVFENDPMEAIFELNMGDFLTEHLISEELLSKIGSSVSDKITRLKNQLKELISIYSFDSTLNLLGFNSKEDYVIYNSIAKTTVQMIDVLTCNILLTTDYVKKDSSFDLVLAGSSEKTSEEVQDSIEGVSYDDLLNPIIQSFNSNKTLYINGSSHSYLGQTFDNKTILVVPMANNNEKVGVIYIETANNKVIPAEYINLLEVSSSLFVTSMKLQKLIEEAKELINDENPSPIDLRQSRTELTAIIGDISEQQQSFVEALAVAVDFKGQYQREHSVNVAELSKEIANYLELNEKSTDLIYYAGLLQNIGKITLPENIFSKRDKLSDEEWNRLQNHPNIGVSLLMKINFLSEVIPYIHYHRERWDGQGSPEGLAGNSIPLGSRIIAVAEAFQAMVAERPYRLPLSKEKAFEILKQEAGIKWDPIIVDALIAINN